MKIAFHEAASEEYHDTARYYANRQAGLELRFIECVENALERILESPTRFPIFEGLIRKCRTRVFQYNVIYSIDGDLIYIIAVTHCHREPRYWRTRVRNK